MRLWKSDNIHRSVNFPRSKLLARRLPLVAIRRRRFIVYLWQIFHGFPAVWFALLIFTELSMDRQLCIQSARICTRLLSGIFCLRIWIYILRTFFSVCTRGAKQDMEVDTIDVGAGNGKSGVNYLKFILKASFPDVEKTRKMRLCVEGAMRQFSGNFAAISWSLSADPARREGERSTGAREQNASKNPWCFHITRTDRRNVPKIKFEVISRRPWLNEKFVLIIFIIILFYCRTIAWRY